MRYKNRVNMRSPLEGDVAEAWGVEGEHANDGGHDGDTVVDSSVSRGLEAEANLFVEDRSIGAAKYDDCELLQGHDCHGDAERRTELYKVDQPSYFMEVCRPSRMAVISD